MILIVGLGNPGKKYQKTRHNIGFRIIDSLDFAQDKGITLLKPRTYMNQSGKEVKKVIENWKLKIENLVVVHDDIDLPLGTIRINKNISSAGHKGVQSIIDELRTKNFTRIRIGILPKTGKPQNVEKFVLQKFTKEEEKIIKKVIKKVSIPCPTHEHQIPSQK
jgi:PTH1 family peptidyl-tRNA hydrolase